MLLNFKFCLPKQGQYALFFIGIIFYQYGCYSFKYSKGGRVESKYRNYYFNDSLKLGAVLYGDMDLSIGDDHQQKLIKVTPLCRYVLRRFGINKSDRLLFTSISSKYSILGRVRNSSMIRYNEYQQVLDRKDSYMMKTLIYKNREAYEGLIRIDSNRFLSIVDYGESDRENAKEGFHTIMINSARRIKSREAMLSVLDPFEDAEELFEEHGYLAAYKLSENRPKYKDQNLFDQALATYYSFSGDQELARQHEASFIGFFKETIKDRDLEPAASAILHKTHDHNIVMFNTAHHRPEHAYFLGQLLERLRQQGFTHLALEALADSSPVMKNGFAVQSDGFYTRDPEISNLISKAIALGYQLVSYDDDSENREQGQARNIFNKTFKKNKNCKVVVLAGYAHIDERATPKKMAVYFKELTGIDPFTIDQTRLMTSKCIDLDPNKKEEVFTYLPKTFGSGMDMQIWNNIQLKEKPIGIELGMAPISIKVELPDSVKLTDHSAIQAVYNQANFIIDSIAVPLHIKMIPAKTESLTLLLYPGKYILQLLGEGKQLLYSRELFVN